jgi:hypothetical protein
MAHPRVLTRRRGPGKHGLPPPAFTVELAAAASSQATGHSPQEQMADFRAYRQRLRQAARQAGLKLSLEVDSKKRSEVQGRLCWFTQHTTDRSATLPEDYGQHGTLSADRALGQPVPDGQHSEVTTVLGHGAVV